MREFELGRLLLVTLAAPRVLRHPRRPRPRVRSHAAARLAALSLAAAVFAVSASVSLYPSPVLALAPCSDGVAGWCLARRIAGDVPDGELGFRFGEPLDVDGDDHADIAAGARYKLERGSLQTGQAGVWSGADGRRIRSWDGAAPGGLFGHWVLPIPDLDGDGRADLVISAPTARIDGDVHGVLVARSPATDRELWSRTGRLAENFGWDLAAAGDHDGDGRSEIFVGAPAREAGRAYLVGGADGAVLRTYAPAEDVATFGWYLARIDDLDGDGHADLVVGSHLEPRGAGELVGAARALSSATGDERHVWRGADHLSGFGEVVAALGDVDGDGTGEIAVAAPRTNDQTRSRPGDVYVYSGATGELLRHWSGSQPGELYGRMIVSAGDVDADGVEDLAVGAPWHARRSTPDAADGQDVRAQPRAGRVEIRSGRTGEVLAEWFGDEADCWFGWHIRRAPDPKRRGRTALLIGSLRHPVDGRAGVGVLDLYVLQVRAREQEPQAVPK